MVTIFLGKDTRGMLKSKANVLSGFGNSVLQKKNVSIHLSTVKPVYNGHPRDPKILAVVQRWPVFGSFSIKIGIKISLDVVDRWPLFRGGR
jgi:hypothetical protein